MIGPDEKGGIFVKRSYAVYQVDAFTKEKLAGNPAGVVLDARGLSDEEMRRIARELNNSETAFLLPGKPGEYDVQVRFFTPTQEVPLCGHGTVSAHVVRAKALGLGDYTRVLQKSGAGVFPVDVVKQGDSYQIIMFQGKADIQESLAPEYQARLCAALGISLEDLRPDCPVCVASTGAGKVMVGIRSLEQLHGLHPDMDALISLSRDIHCNGYHVFTLHPEETPLVHARMFAPANGNPEDPVTGTANGPLGAYLVRFGLIPPEGEQVSFTVIQGEAIRRAGTMEVRVALEDGAPGEIQIVGDAVIAFQTTLELED